MKYIVSNTKDERSEIIEAKTGLSAIYLSKQRPNNKTIKRMGMYIGNKEAVMVLKDMTCVIATAYEEKEIENT